MSFKSLVCAVSVQCQEIRQALASISYFDRWDADVVAECCRVSSVAEYPADKIILGPDTGTSHTVYFILEGVCRMVQNLLVEVETNSREKKLRKLYTFLNSKTLNSKSTDAGYSSRLLSQLSRADKKIEIVGGHEEERHSEKTKADINGDAAGEEEEKSGKAEVEDADVEASNTRGTGDDAALTQMVTQEQNQKVILTNANAAEGDPKLEEKQEKDPNLEFGAPPGEESVSAAQESERRGKILFEADHHVKILEECKERGKETTEVSNKHSLPEKPENVEGFFVQIGFLYKGACFGLEKCQGENFIMSIGKVKCLKIPRRFLFKHNPCYTWNRIGLYHSLYLPKDEEILHNLRSDRKWIRKKEKLSREIVSSRNIPNDTLDSEVPYSIRLANLL